KEGRFFNNQDEEKSQAVVVIDEVFAHKYFPQGNAVGRRINLGDDRDPRQIVGVVGHVKQWSLASDDGESLQAQLYQAFRQQSGSPGTVDVLMRTASISGRPGAMPAGLEASVRQVVQRQNSQNVLYNFRTMTQVVYSTLAARRFSVILLDAFALAALLL